MIGLDLSDCPPATKRRKTTWAILEGDRLRVVRKRRRKGSERGSQCREFLVGCLGYTPTMYTRIKRLKRPVLFAFRREDKYWLVFTGEPLKPTCRFGRSVRAPTGLWRVGRAGRILLASMLLGAAGAGGFAAWKRYGSEGAKGKDVVSCQWSAEEPMTRRQTSGETVYKGLPNVGNTCWMNSVLQVLASVEEKGAVFLPSENKSTTPLVDILQNLRDGKGASRKILEDLHKRSGLQDGNRQHDPSEFIQTKLEFKKELFEFKTKSAFVCKTAEGKTKSKTKPAIAASVHVLHVKFPNNENTIKLSFEPVTESLDTEKMEFGNIKYTCNTMEKTTCYENPSKYFLVYLNRTHTKKDDDGKPIMIRTRDDKERAVEIKDPRPIENVSEITVDKKEYRLIAAACHKGQGIGGGHWVALAKRPDGKVYLFNDSLPPEEFTGGFESLTTDKQTNRNLLPVVMLFKREEKTTRVDEAEYFVIGGKEMTFPWSSIDPHYVPLEITSDRGGENPSSNRFTLTLPASNATYLDWKDMILNNVPKGKDILLDYGVSSQVPCKDESSSRGEISSFISSEAMSLKSGTCFKELGDLGVGIADHVKRFALPRKLIDTKEDKDFAEKEANKTLQAGKEAGMKRLDERKRLKNQLKTRLKEAYGRKEPTYVKFFQHTKKASDFAKAIEWAVFSKK